ncbi:kinase-like domain-containing protein [Thelephora terrestris]|uniref:Kinase-like domain-containing protein n=1 Tax=Thelephora terrestris TaxID=56493 RepID=A0A9P6H811_9AGAM|nr:kinase-like domain-containing protein [Thelephora terrestris]
MATDNNRGPRPAHVLDPEDILQQWKGLLSRSLKRIDLHQVANLVKENREIAMKFRGKDAATIINAIDKLLKGGQLPDETQKRALNLMRRLAGASRQVPKSYLVGIFTRCKVEKTIFANGGFADVRKGRLKGKDVAIKTIRTSLQDEIEGRIILIHEAFCKECVVWMNMSHPNIHQLTAVIIKPDAREFSMVSEMMKNGNILIYTKRNKANRIRLVVDIARGLEYLHKSGVIHGDLKGPNILINNETPPQACIADFGLSAIAPSMSFRPTQGGAVGTFGYMAPELLSGVQASKEADMYAFGIVVMR